MEVAVSIVLILMVMASSVALLARLPRGQDGSPRIERYVAEARAHFDRGSG